MLKVAIIGSNGFIGKHLTERLLGEKGTSLFLFGKSDTPLITGAPYKKIDFFDEKALQNDFKDIDVVYYLASETIPATSWNSPLIEIEKNLTPFISFLEVISRLKVKKIAFISSAGTVYGATTGKVTEHSDKNPFSPYGITKLAMENFLLYYKTRFNLNYDVYRVSNVYGEGQNTGKGLGIINTFLENIIRESKVKIFGTGESTRNYIYVKDVVELVCLSLHSPDHSDVYNVSSNSTVSIRELVGILKEVVEEDFQVIHENARQSDNPYIDLENGKILERAENFHFTPLPEGIRKTYLFLKSQTGKRN
jgi:UDP-glucose 4-epimerase